MSNVYGNIFVCKKIQEANDSAVLIAPLADFSVPFLPTTVSFSVYANAVIEGKIDSPTVEISIIRASVPDSELFSAGGELRGTGQFIEIKYDVSDLILKEEGTYQAIFKIDDNVVATYTFNVTNNNIDL